MRNGLFEENGELVYYKDDTPYHAGVINENGDIYYIGKGGRAVKGRHAVHSNMANGLLEAGVHQFGDDYKLVKIDVNKNGLFEENGKFTYYKNGKPYHAGVIKNGKDIYYIGSDGHPVKGEYVIHGVMTNRILKHGTYTFGEDYKLVPKSYIAPTKKKKKNSKNHKVEISVKNQIIIIISAVVVLVVAVGVTMGIEHFKMPGDAEPTESSEQTIKLPVFEEDVLLCSEAAKQAYDGEITIQQAIAAGDPYRPFEFEYQLADRDGILTLSEYADMHNAKEFTLSAKMKSITIDNLKVGTVYYYTVTIGKETYPGSFKTAESTRFVNIPGVKNTRDIGGYTTLDGKKVKQGMLIRGSEIDGLVEPTYILNSEYVDYVKDTFGFVYDFDFRTEEDTFMGNYISPLGKDVKHSFHYTPQYGWIYLPSYQSSLRQIFAELADPQNYPVYAHCIYGADRTGTICFILEAILNLPEEVIEMDYHWTGVLATSNKYQSIYGGLDGYEGTTKQEKIVNYLTSPEVGVTMEQIESIRSIFLEQ